MRDEDFVELSAYLRVLEKRLLSTADIERISEASDLSETLKQISQSSEYDFSALNDSENYESVIKDGLKQTYDMIYNRIPHRIVVDLAVVKYDFHNLKVLFKSSQLDVDTSYLYSDLSSLDIDKARSFLSAPSESTLESYAKKALTETGEVFAKSLDPQDIDIIMDRHLFERMLEICAVINSSFITEYVRHIIDFHNLKAFLRIQQMRKGTRFLDICLCDGGLTDRSYFNENYNKTPEMLASVFYYKYFGNIAGKGIDGYTRTGNYGILDKLLDDYLVEYINKAKYVAFGPEVPFAYIASKENEARQIRLLISCKKNKMRTEILRERLRKNYA